METYLVISFLNDFIFCPRSIYFHQLYDSVDKSVYQSKTQINGTAAHKNLDKGLYTTSSSILQSIPIYSERYRICGKIDLFDKSKSLLIERKKKVQKIYDGYIFQLYAQYYCLVEMGFNVKEMKIYSYQDNKNYPISIPPENHCMQLKFEQLIKQIHSFKLDSHFIPNKNKCENCIYNSICDISLAEED